MAKHALPNALRRDDMTHEPVTQVAEERCAVNLADGKSLLGGSLVHQRAPADHAGPHTGLSPSTSSPSWRSIARLALPSRLALNRPEGSLSEAPLAKVSFTTLLYVWPVQISPS